MSSMSNPDQQIVRSLVETLEQSGHTVLLGYSAEGLSELKPPAILVQLDSIREQERKGQKAKYLMEFTVSSVIRTSESVTYDLMAIVHSIRTLLSEWDSINDGIRKLFFSETQFDIAPSHAQLSFADLTVTLEAVY